jgi:hypothetical protein
MGACIGETIEGVMLKCLNNKEAKVAMGTILEGICGMHQAAPKMRWALRSTTRKIKLFVGQNNFRRLEETSMKIK